MSNDQLSTRDYERVADASRRRLASSLDDLSRSLTPGRMLDEVMTYARGGGTDFFRGLGKAASANPIPTLLVSVGSIMFLSGKGRLGSDGSSAARRARSNARSGTGDFAREAAADMQHGAESIGSAVSDATGRAADKLASAGSAAAGQVGKAADAIRSAAASGAEKAKNALETGASAVGGAASEFASDAADEVAEKAAYVRDETSALFDDLTERATTLAREQPLLVAAAGLAVGAMVAALLPRTATEDSFLGEASDAVKDTVGEVAGEQYERAKSVAANVLDEAKTAAERQGLTPESAADAVRDLGDRVKNVVSEVAGSRS